MFANFPSTVEQLQTFLVIFENVQLRANFYTKKIINKETKLA